MNESVFWKTENTNPINKNNGLPVDLEWKKENTDPISTSNGLPSSRLRVFYGRRT